jgi:FAD/FMN-containing dehydrogenase
MSSINRLERKCLATKHRAGKHPPWLCMKGQEYEGSGAVGRRLSGPDRTGDRADGDNRDKRSDVRDNGNASAGVDVNADADVCDVGCRDSHDKRWRCNVVARGPTICIDTANPPLPYCPENALLFRSNGALECGTLERFAAIGLDWRKVLETLPSTFFPWDTCYNTARLIPDRLFNYFPDMVIYVRSEKEVGLAIALSVRYGLALSVRGAGHLRAYFAVQHPIIVDTSPLNGIRWKTRECGCGKRKPALRLGAGLRQGPVLDLLAGRDTVLASGTCPGVGVVGLLSGGGIGFAMRKYGLFADQLLSAKVVLADGSVRKAGRRENEDLFFAIRGAGGGNYGVVTEITVKAHPLKGKPVSVYVVEWPFASAVDAIDAFQRWAPDTDRGVTSQLNATRDAISAQGALIGGGGPDRLRELIAPLLAVEGARVVTLREATLHEYYSLDTGNSDLSKNPYFINRNGFIRRHLSRRAIGKFVKHIAAAPREVPGAFSFGLWSMGGAVADVPPDATAFYWRKSRMWWILRCGFVLQQDYGIVERYARMFFSAVEDQLKGIYVNYPVLGLPDYLREYWGKNVPRLERIKAQVDPDNVFHHTQGIPPALVGKSESEE